jgi:LacI family transcriptional regulator
MARRPTISDLAEKAGVSVATVDRVLNQRLPVRGGTALRVVAAAEAIGYHATGLLKQRLSDLPARTFGFLLQKRDDVFYQAFGEKLVAATKAAPGIRGRAVVEFMDEIVPSLIAGKIRDVGARADALAVVAIDHPMVNEAVELVAAKGKPVFTLLSDIAAPSRAGYLATDSRKAGRTAAWAVSRLAKAPGKIGILLGSHRYLSQELSEISFRSYMRELAPEFQLMEPLINLDDQRVAYEAVSDLVTSNPDLAGIYVSGGGAEGMVRALRDENAGGRVIAVCNELVPVTRQALIDGVVDLVLGTPIQQISARAVELMAAATGGAAREGLAQVLLPADIYISENI